VGRGLAETRERAHALILAGSVEVNGQRATRPAQLIATDSDVVITATGPEYVSRGALKLEAALDHWAIDPRGKIALDVGASTGGFTELLLKRGANRVYAVDVGYGQLHYKLRNDPRVISMERTNIRYLTGLPEQADLGVVDVSFISLRLALPVVFGLVKDELVALIKPQFEAGREHVKKGGVVRDPAVHRQVVRDLVEWSPAQPWQLTAVIPSPITGPAGNREFLSLWRRGAQPLALERIEHDLAEGAIIHSAPTTDP
jgi:23S rRNA (cytidine1920-2'-O)/16S rRNA (cytidine1409-2'-O)-methyltransferase